MTNDDLQKEEEAKELLQQRGNEIENAQNFAEKRDTLPMPNTGYNALPLDSLPSGGKFYDPKFSIQIKAATAKDVRHFSSIDDRDPFNIYQKLAFILKNNCKFSHGFSYKDIVDVDRFFIVYSIRQLTFKTQPSLETTIECLDCGTSNKVQIHKENSYRFKLDERLWKFYDATKRCFNFKLDDLDFNFVIYLPTVGASEFIADNVETNRRKQTYINEDLLEILPYFVSDHKKFNNKKMKKLDEDILQWTPEQMSAVIQIINLFREAVDPQIHFTCTACGEGNDQYFMFQNGLKELFMVNSDTLLDDLLGK